ncbi:MAG: hypothetical protein COW18_06400 [Zetaproteobacteria bacterium CG12_big_fil_rev_8_21_14_0_65_54_13]|nr:MAG: hypothetical protein COX55_06155 [Zetaproteobacteria bacterium CG23_combo_of_CG06-09_8_20_14_all_54_7]PIW48804.1 MAG: hypothetical protein COW18_06400 [Zetaproteobacteria bacterium CG12_big_fil_rev_8_21_14_0_65_54_13]PIX53429.1 MAG: hypothetical protein COZ50_13310 [Zetaproteobacteria bacterium CG_4_10_14_3_um_filter_54_28]PJA30386.1 MAG: hypothetical protein CO188_03730 [Zetaproteobacteria bacterium CG_4_9_14_3_um_filter_54_145]
MDALNAHLLSECDRPASDRQHPTMKEKTILEAFEDERSLQIMCASPMRPILSMNADPAA